MTYQPHQSEDLALKTADTPDDDDWELPAQCPLRDSDEECESCQ